MNTATKTAPFEIVTDDQGNPIQSNTIPWLRKRQTGVGASEGPAILEMSTYDSPRDVARGKLADTITDEQTEAMEFGHEMETVAVRMFKRRHGDPENTRHKYLGNIQDAPGLIRSTEFPHLLASLDSVIVEPDGHLAPGQIKNVTVYKRGSWDESEGGVPDAVRVQVLHECIVFGASHGFALPIFGGNSMPEPIRIDLTDEFAEWYTGYTREWWDTYPGAGVLPDPTILDDLSEIWAGIAGESVTLPPDLVAAAAEHKTLGAQIKEMTERRDALALDVKIAMGDATEGWSDGEGNLANRRLVATWRPHKSPRRVFDKVQLLADHPELADLFEAYTVDGKTPRPFLSK